jgi:hypothetical protein
MAMNKQLSKAIMTLTVYLKDRRGLEYYARIAKLTEEELSALWEEVNEKAYWWFLEFCVPAHSELMAFATGEPTCDGVEGTLHTTGVEVKGRYFLRPATVELFNRDRYVSEIDKKFRLGKRS